MNSTAGWRPLPAAILLFLALPLGAADNEYLQALRARAREMDLSAQKPWQVLMHGKRGLFGWSSRVDGKAFFLSERGHKDARAEMEATLEAFFAPLPEDPAAQHPQCRFPARYAWLKSKLLFDPALLPEAPCAKFEGWASRFEAGSVSLVYASSYLNNPASMYGHTFLKVNRPAGTGQALLDYTVNFAAETPTRSGLVFAAKGLLGGYPGRFTTEPYYFKVQQYNNMESRDLWEFPLTLTPEQVRAMLAHLWELGDTYFNYFFLTENCSYQLLPALEAANPALDLSERFDFKAIPSDTVRAVLDSPGLAGPAALRPSAMRLILARRALLSWTELAAAETLAKGRGSPPFDALDGFAPERQALILDSAYDYFRYRHGFKRFQTPETDAYERDLLARRGALGLKSSDVAQPSPAPAEPPEIGHRTGRLGAGHGARGGESFEEITLRGAMHDLEDDPAGYIPRTKLEMFHLKLRHDNRRGKSFVQKMTFVDIVSFSPLDRWVKYPSWKFFLGLERAEDLRLEHEKGLHPRLSAGTGPAFAPFGPKGPTFYALVEVDGGAGKAFRDGYRLGAGGTGGAMAAWGRRARTRVEGGWRRYFAGDVRPVTLAEVNQSVSLTKNMELRAALRRLGPNKESLFTFHYYL